MKKIFTLFMVVLSINTFAQNDTSKIREAKINLIKYLNLTSYMLSESTGIAIKYDENEQGKPTELKYSAQIRQVFLAKASEYYSEVASNYKIIISSLTQEEKDKIQKINDYISKLIKDDKYKSLISTPTLSLTPEQIGPSVTFIEIIKTKIDDITELMFE